MKIRYFMSLVIVMTLLLGTSSFSSANVSDIIENEYQFRINESADYTNHIDTSMLISVKGQKKLAFSLIDFGGDDNNGYWLQGLEQLDIENEVHVGALYHGGFNATSGGEKIAGVNLFNRTIPSLSNYDTSIKAIPAPFLYNTTSSEVSIIDGTLFPSALVGAPVEEFVYNEEEWISSLEAFFLGYKNKVETMLGLDVEVETQTRSLSYSISGEMSDIHEFTFHHHILTALDYNRVQVEGGFDIKYNNDGVLDSYSEQYDISYEDQLIMNYDFEVKVGAGSLGNVKVGDNKIISYGQLTYLVLILITLPIVRRILVDKIFNKIN